MKKLLLPILCFVSFNCIIHAQVVSLPSEGWSLNLGKEFPGATGSLAYAPVTGPTGEIAYRLQGSFLQGGAYVSAGLGNLDLVLTSITFQVRASGLPAIAVRLTDGSGQIHQINRIDLEKVAGVHEGGCCVSQPTLLLALASCLRYTSLKANFENTLYEQQ